MEAGRVNSPSSELEDIQTQCSILTSLISEQYAKLAEERKKLEQEKERFEATHRIIASFEDPIKLNVGGKIFTTSKLTILKHESMLSAMFSGRHALQKGEDGAYFINRNPKHFGKILDFLRDGQFEMPKRETKKKEILHEAEFYSMTSLIEYMSRSESQDLSPAIPLHFNPIFKGPDVTINGDTAINNTDLWQPAFTSPFSTGVHLCSFSCTSTSHIVTHFNTMVGVTGTNLENYNYNVYTQPQSMMLYNNGSLYVGGRKAMSLASYPAGIVTVEVDCDNRLVTWIYDNNRFTKQIHENLQPPFCFCVDLNESAATITAIQ